MKNVFTRQNIPTLKLAASYLVIIMVMSLISSLVFYSTSSHELNKKPEVGDYGQTSFQDPDHELDEWLGRRADASRGSLLGSLVAINTVVLFGGSIFSYILARRTLRPIEESIRAQNRFVADASHELRTPLAAILLSNEMALRRKQLSGGDARKVIKQNIEDINYLKALSDELLDLTGTASKPKLAVARMEDIVKSAVARVASAASEKNITISTDGANVDLQTNKSMLEKLLVIFLDNAIKYSPENTSVVIRTELSERFVSVHVHDHGPGISKTDIPRVFDRFYRADTSRTEVGGHGLGLAIAKKIADDLHYEVSVSSVYGSGSVFTVKIRIK